MNGVDHVANVGQLESDVHSAPDRSAKAIGSPFTHSRRAGAALRDIRLAITCAGESGSRHQMPAVGSRSR
jgi:hypothetical protein